tara:strand:+ start:8070 stop:8780 length:711 start_codon:yes stop_codon:yes gene_type:complete
MSSFFDCEFACELLYLDRVCRCKMHTPYLTVTFALLLVGVYTSACGFTLGECVAYQGSLALASDTPPGSTDAYRMWTLVLSHASWLHLVLNLLSTVHLSALVETVHGPARLAVVTACATYFGSLNFLWNGRPRVEMVGASSIAYGMIGAYAQSVLLNGAWRRRTRRKLVARVLLLGGQVLLEVAVATYAGGHVATTAHIGGFLAGFTSGVAVLSERYRPAALLAVGCLLGSKYAGI